MIVTAAIVDALEVECESLDDLNSPQILSIPDVSVNFLHILLRTLTPGDSEPD